MVDIVGTLKPELWGIWSSFGGPESVMIDWKYRECSAGKEKKTLDTLM